LARKTTTKGADAPAKQSTAAKSTPGALAIDSISKGIARRRGKVLIVLAVVLICGWGVKAVWRQAAPLVASRGRYILPAARITTSQAPEWLVADVRGQVVENSRLDGRLSILDPDFVESIRHAFSLHPWVQSVDRLEKRYPPAVHVELTFRQPVAAVETARGELLPVDSAANHLPADDVPLIRRKYLPRITGIVGQPPVGQGWEDPRVAGAVAIAVRLAEVWEPLHLEVIAPRARPELRSEQQFYVYDIVTRGGTQIIWGASPDAAAPGEAEFMVKLQRLQQCVEQYGPLDSVKAPGTVDVRGELHVEPRLVKHSEEVGEDATVVK
jgi:hypothetical protein